MAESYEDTEVMTGVLTQRRMSVVSEVDRLYRKFGVPIPGTHISHVEVSEVIGAEPKGPTEDRYRTIIAAWRKALFNRHSLVLGAEIGIGYVVLTASGMVTHAKSNTRKMARIGAKTRQVLVVTDTTKLSPVEQAQHAKLSEFHVMTAIHTKQLASDAGIPELAPYTALPKSLLMEEAKKLDAANEEEEVPESTETQKD